MGTVIEIFMMACFCLIAGYLLGYLQRAVALLERQAAHLELLATKTAEMAGALPAPPLDQMPGALPPGYYTLGEPDPKTGLTALYPLTQNNKV